MNGASPGRRNSSTSVLRAEHALEQQRPVLQFADRIEIAHDAAEMLDTAGEHHVRAALQRHLGGVIEIRAERADHHARDRGEQHRGASRQRTFGPQLHEPSPKV